MYFGVKKKRFFYMFWGLSKFAFLLVRAGLPPKISRRKNSLLHRQAAKATWPGIDPKQTTSILFS